MRMEKFHIDCNGMGILQVTEVLKDLESKGQVVDWNELKNSINSRGSAISDVWITSVDQGEVQFL